MTTLRELCEEGARRIGCDLTNPEYAARLNRELAVIDAKGFADYFYIVGDMVHFAKSKMLVGPGRGSSAGSLVCYLLGITTIDPFVYGTMFERFLDETRNDFPDIDVDVSDAKRDLVFEYMANKYGRERVARLGTVGMMGAKSALKQAAMMLAIPAYAPEKVSKNMIERFAGDERADKCLEDTLFMTEYGHELRKVYPEIIVGTQFEAHPAHPSQHAAGLLLTKNPIEDYVAVDHRNFTAMIDLKDAGALNLLKLDLLGLTQLGIFERTLELAGLPVTNEFLRSIPLNDQKAFDVINVGHYSGIFQITGKAIRDLTKRIRHVDRLDDLIAVSALGRPGPKEAGAAERWVMRRNGDEAVEVIHPSLEAITEKTYGVIVYQEQVLHIVREIGGMSWGDANKIRKLISKTQGHEIFEQFGKPFIEGAKNMHKMREAIAQDIWASICHMGAYAFNLSHAVAYGLMSYYCCWLKAHYPLEFAAATLDAQGDTDKQLEILRELNEEGVEYVAFDPELSGARWQIAEREGKRFLVGPITNMVGIGPSAMMEIMAHRYEGKPLRASLVEKLKYVSTPIDSLTPVADALERVCPDLPALGVDTIPKTVAEIRALQRPFRDMQLIVGVVSKVTVKDSNDPDKLKSRGYKVKGPTKFINVTMKDDTGEFLCQIDRFHFEELGQRILDVGEVGNAIIAIKGDITEFGPENFRMMRVDNFKHLGYMRQPKHANNPKEPA